MCTKPLVTNGISKGKQVTFMKITGNEALKNEINKPSTYLGSSLLKCNKCLECKMDNAREWALRSTLHIKEEPENNWFLTITYTEKEVPKNINGMNTIKKQDLTDFLNKLRAHQNREWKAGRLKNKPTFKYLAASEYGSRTLRPHFHLIFFGLELNDLEKTNKANKIEQQYYISKTIDKIWNKGMHVIGEVSYDSAGYVARYTFKKQTKLDYNNLQIEPETLRMSKGIGKPYFDKNWEKIYQYDKIHFMKDEKLMSTSPPRYYDRQMKKIGEEDLLEQAQKQRIQNVKLKIYEQQKNNKTFVENMDARKQLLLEKSRNLKRNLKNQK